MKQQKMLPKMVDGWEMVRTTEEIYDIQKTHWLEKIKSVLKIRDKKKDKSNIDRCVLEDDYYIKNFNSNRFSQYDEDLTNNPSKSDMKEFRGLYEDYMENWRLYRTNKEGYISPIMINWWFKYFRNELKNLL